MVSFPELLFSIYSYKYHQESSDQFRFLENRPHVIFYVLPWLLVTGESRTRLGHGWWVSSQSIVGIIAGGKMLPHRAAMAAIGCCVV